MDEDLVCEIVEVLESLIEDMPMRARVELESIIVDLKKPNLNMERVLGLQDRLEAFCGSSSIDSYSRAEIYNVLSLFENLL